MALIRASLCLVSAEDDMSLPLERKQQLLGEFHEYLYKEEWTFTESGPNEKDRVLLCEFDIVIKEFIALKPVCRNEWCHDCAIRPSTHVMPGRLG